MLASVLREMEAIRVEEECATAATGDYHLTKICRFQIGCSGQVTLQESVLREMEAILEEEEEQFAIVVTGEFQEACCDVI